ncbi:hypothetical protein GCM10009808_23940 [Microbacterium sediminicola]|uniref:DUF2520 domain-containing protein n=1 Tax=Microbacterium sediminicola TaxID=415210 RepID=A0ABN2IHI3_9MICO
MSDRLKVGIIGAGRVGPVLGAALAGAGHEVVGITRGSDDDRLEAILPGVEVCEATDVVARSQLIVIAVPHDQLEGLVSGLAEVGAWMPGQLVLHTDPAFGVEVLTPALMKGAIPLAIHPAITFTGASIDLRALAGAFAAVTAPVPVMPIAQALAVEIGCEPVIVAEAERPRYAEAISTATEFSRSIIEQSTELLRAAGVAEPGRYLEALVHTTVDQALAAGGETPPAG